MKRAIMEDLLQSLGKKIEERLIKFKSISIEKLGSESAKNVLISNLAKENTVLWITAEKSDSLVKCLKLRKYFPRTFHYQNIVGEKSKLNIIQQLKTLINLMSGKSNLFVTDIASFYSFQISKESLFSNSIKINKNCDMNKLVKKIFTLGYQQEDRVVIEGDYSVRGEIIDLFTPQFNLPIRIIFDNDIIENMYLFNPSDGRKMQEVNEFCLVPLNFKPSRQTIFDYLNPRTVIVFDSPEKIANVSQSLNLIDSKYLKLNELILKLKKHKKIFLDPLFGFFTASKKVEAYLYKGFQYNGDLSRLISDSAVLKDKGYKFYYHGKYFLKILEILKTHNINLRETSINLSENIIFKDKKIILFCDEGVFGKYKTFQRHKVSQEQKEFIASLTSGEIFVHQDYGICKFITTIKLNVLSLGKDIEYIVLEFAGNDRLYLPSQNINKLSKYVGTFSENVKLTKLGTPQWLNIKKRVEESTYKFAQDILRMSAIRSIDKGYGFVLNEKWKRILEKSFSYKETKDQLNAIHDVYKDMQSTKIMDRLICGDVGFGKTEVAIRAAALACANNKQVLVLCPTTILAEQHKATFLKRMKDLPLEIESISRFKSKGEQRKIIAKMKKGVIDVVIGTHRLLSSDIKFKNLGLVIIDEEQRFGVKDKEKLKKIRSNVDVLALSATPIPRTLYLTLGGLKDISKIQTSPAGRLRIYTEITDKDDGAIKEIIEKEIKRGGQVYYVSNCVNTIQLVAQRLQKIFPKLRIGVAHGQMRTSVLAQVMADFTSQKYDILVTTKIVENGLDLANVNTLIVENADRFGLGELYQLRGRIGRGQRQAFAYFIVDPSKLTEQTRRRLVTLLENDELGSGYAVSERDLELRGGGNVLGKEQSGNIAEVGLNLYSQLLKQAIRKIKAK